MKALKFEVDGMSCGHCVGRVEKALRSVPGVEIKKVMVGTAEVVLDPSRSSREAVVAAIEAAGYDAHEAAGVTAEKDSNCCGG